MRRDVLESIYCWHLQDAHLPEVQADGDNEDYDERTDPHQTVRQHRSLNEETCQEALHLK